MPPTLRRAVLAAAVGSLAALTSGCVSLLTSWVPGLACSWERDPTGCLQRDFPGYEGALGVSDPLPSEREADNQARSDAVQKLLAQILGVDVATELTVSQTEEATPGASEYRAEVRLRGTYRVDGALPSFALLRRSVERDSQGRYIVRVLLGVRDPARVRSTFYRELVSGLSAARSELEGYVRTGDFHPPAFTRAVQRFTAYLESLERFQGRHGLPAAGGASLSLAEQRSFLAAANQSFVNHYRQRIDSLVARDEYAGAIELAIQLYLSTSDSRWETEATALTGEMIRRARELYAHGEYDAALQVLTVSDEVKRYLSEAQSARLSEIVVLALRIQDAQREARFRPPSPPSRLQATVEVGGIRLRWEAGAGRPPAGYRVYRAEAPLASGADAVPEAMFRPVGSIVNGSESGYLDPVAPGRTYAYRVAAVNEAGVEGRPGETVVIRFYHPLTAPTDLRAQRNADGTYLATWSHPHLDELDGFLVTLHEEGTMPTAPVRISAPMLAAGRLAVDRRYRLEVSALRQDGQVGPSASYAFWTPPPPPADVRAEQSPEGLVITWDAQSRQNLLAVRLYRAGDSALLGERTYRELSGKRWVWTQYAVGQPFDFYLTHVGEDGAESAPSETVSLVPHSYPAPVSGLRVLPVAARVALLSWAPSPEPDVAGYVVERLAESESTWHLVGRVNRTSVVDSSLADDTRYTYRVAAFNQAGITSPPVEVTWVTRPASPVDVRVEPAGDRAVAVGWTDPSRYPVSGYEVYRQQPDGQKIRLAGTSSRRVVDEGLRYGVTYQYQVVAVRDGQPSEPSPWTSITLYSNPAAPAGMESRVQVDGSVQLTWQPNTEEDVAGYRVYRSDASAPGVWELRGSTSATFFIDKLEEGSQYVYRVVAYNRAREGQAAELNVSARPLPPTSVEARRIEGGVAVRWANPNAYPVVRFRVYRGLVGSKPDQLRYLGQTVEPAYLDVGPLTPGLLYVYQITAVNEDGVESNLSAPALYRAP